MRAATRVKVTNKVFLTTFLVAFSSVAMSSIIPCPVQTLDSDSPVDEQRKQQMKRQIELLQKKNME